MAQFSIPQPTPGAESPTDVRLESWKEIATFVRKGVRTVQRWEATECLPVHRHVHEKGCTVFAYKSELREWYAIRDPDLRERVQRDAAAPPVRGKNLRMWVFGGSATLALLISIVTTQLPKGARPAGKVATPVLLISHAGRASQTVLSPDGERIVYCWNGEHGGQQSLGLYVKDLKDGRPKRLTAQSTNDHSPAWSPDGRFIAFLRNEEGVFVIPADSGPEHKVMGVTPSAEFAVGMSWSPDGRWLVFSYRPSSAEPFTLVVLPANGGEMTKLTSPPAGAVGDMYPAHSPDGCRLAFMREVGGPTNDVYTLELSEDGLPTSEPVRLTFDNRWVFGVGWLRDGREIIFSSDRLGVRRLWVVSVDELRGQPQPPRPLAFAGEHGYQPTVSRRGDRLVYSRRYWTSGIWQVNVSSRRHPVSTPVNVIAPARENYDAQYSPDGQKISFVSNRTDATEIWMCDRDGSNATQMTQFGRGATVGGRWSPDGRHLVFHSRSEGRASIYIVGANGGTPRCMTHDDSYCFAPNWSRDGKWIYYTSNRTGKNQIWKMAVEGETSMQLTQNGGEYPVESRDGKWVYYRNEGLFRIPVSGGVASKVLDPPVGSFDVGTRNIYFDRGFGDFVRSTLYVLDLETGKIKAIASLERSKLGGLSVSPDGRFLLFSLRDREGTDLMLVENLIDRNFLF